MSALLSILYGLATYTFFLGTFLYTVGFVGNIAVPKSIDTGAVAPLAEAVVVDLLLLALFAVQHSVMARPAFKRWWTRLVPQSVERSTYVLFASAALALLLWQWRPIAEPVIWVVTDPRAIAVLNAVFWSGWIVLLASTFMISHFELFGLRQVFARLLDLPLRDPTFKKPLFYRYVRHPIYLGFLLAFWAAPVMTAGHLLFSVMMTGYVLIGIFFEERDLIHQFGDQYRRYRSQAGMLLPRLGAGATDPADTTTQGRTP